MRELKKKSIELILEKSFNQNKKSKRKTNDLKKY